MRRVLMAAGALWAAGCGSPGNPDEGITCEPVVRTYTRSLSDTPVCGGRSMPLGLERVGAAAVAERGTSEQAYDLWVAHGHAYVASIDGGLTVFDVSDPANPQRRARFTTPQDTFWSAVTATDSTLYVGTAVSGVRIYDLTNPAQPVFVRAVPDGGAYVGALFVHGNLLFASLRSGGGGVQVYDITDPRAPVLRGTYVSPAFFPGGGNSGQVDMFALEGRLYVNYTDLGFEVVDLADPAKPKFLGAYRYSGAYSSSGRVKRYGDKLYAFEASEGPGMQLTVLDVTDPAQPAVVAEWKRVNDAAIHKMVLQGNRLYVSHFTQGNWVLDVTDPTAPCELADDLALRPTNTCAGTPQLESGAVGIRAPGDGYIYTADSSRGLYILRDPAP